MVYFKTYNSYPLILGIEQIDGSSAEHIQKAIEKIINTYSFDYKKILGKVIYILKNNKINLI